MLTKLIGALAGVMLLAGNAWAFNEDLGATVKDWQAAAELCARVTDGVRTSYGVCQIKSAPSEAQAVSAAKDALVSYCGGDDSLRQELCAETRAYIKQRWGY